LNITGNYNVAFISPVPSSKAMLQMYPVVRNAKSFSPDYRDLGKFKVPATPEDDDVPGLSSYSDDEDDA